MENQKWLYFAKQADEVNLNGIDDCVALPAKNLISISPTANNRVTMYFESVQNSDPLGAPDTVVLETIVGDAFEVADTIISYINATVPHDGFITIADDTVTQDPGDARIDAVYAHPSITAVNAINISDSILTEHDYGWSIHAGIAPTTEPANTGTFAVNTHTIVTTTAARAWKIPSSEDGRAGDWISVLYSANIADETVHTYTVETDANYVFGSIIRVIGNDATRIGVIDIASTNDNVITIAGLDNGDGGIGTRVMFRNMTGESSGWAVECVVEGQGTQAVASTGTVFS